MIRRHQADGDLQLGDLFVTFPTNRPLVNETISSWQVESVNPLEVLDCQTGELHQFESPFIEDLVFAERI